MLASYQGWEAVVTIVVQDQNNHSSTSSLACDTSDVYESTGGHLQTSTNLVILFFGDTFTLHQADLFKHSLGSANFFHFDLNFSWWIK
jgi:hypothetical protein